MSLWEKDPATGLPVMIAGMAPLADDLTTTTPGSALDARQGKVISDLLDGKLEKIKTIWSGNWGNNGSSPLVLPVKPDYSYVYAVTNSGQLILLYLTASPVLFYSYPDANNMFTIVQQFAYDPNTATLSVPTMNYYIITGKTNGLQNAAPISFNTIQAILSN